ncbi:unnamed protein product, partial [Darwinula stevensoni]
KQHGRDVDTNQLSVNSLDKVFFTVTPSSSMETLNMPEDDCKDITISVPITSTGGDEPASSKPRQRKMSVISMDWVKEKWRLAQEEKEKKKAKKEMTFKEMTPQEIAIFIDEKSRIFFPICFIIFCILYWTLIIIL